MSESADIDPACAAADGGNLQTLDQARAYVEAAKGRFIIDAWQALIEAFLLVELQDAVKAVGAMKVDKHPIRIG